MSCLNWISFSFSYQPIPRYRITHRQPVSSGPEELKIWMSHTYKRRTLSYHLMSGKSRVSCQKANTQWTMFVLWDSWCDLADRCEFVLFQRRFLLLRFGTECLPISGGGLDGKQGTRWLKTN